jgi:hypothetical protein
MTAKEIAKLTGYKEVTIRKYSRILGIEYQGQGNRKTYTWHDADVERFLVVVGIGGGTKKFLKKNLDDSFYNGKPFEPSANGNILHLYPPGAAPIFLLLFQVANESQCSRLCGGFVFWGSGIGSGHRVGLGIPPLGGDKQLLRPHPPIRRKNKCTMPVNLR